MAHHFLKIFTLKKRKNETLKQTMKYLYKIGLIALLAMVSATSYAQIQDPLSPGYDEYNPDSNETEDGYYNDESNPNKDKKEGPVYKPYVRIVLPFDSVTNLITYTGIVEQEESGSDSLYIRAKRWAEKYFNKGLKVESDKRNQKITYLASIPAYSYNNPYNRKLIGTFEFKFTVLIKEGRYKYQITNLVHESVKPASGKSTRNYFEYYYTTTTNVQVSDRILRYADKEINQMIASFKKAMAEPILLDEDDW